MQSKLMRFPFEAMGSFCEIQLFEDSRIEAKKLARELSNEVARLEEKYSRFSAHSFLSEINRSAGAKRGIEIDNETSALLDHAENCFQSSEGLFDITATPLQHIWNFKKASVPSESQIAAALELVGYDRLSRRGSILTLPLGTQVDFGGIVKEYAADSAARLGRNLGAQHGLINLGGDFSIIGPQIGDRPWSVGITRPDSEHPIMAKIDLFDGGLASSGDYERFFVHEGKRYSHIINPKTGWPCSGLRAVSIAANLCTVAGSVATLAMLKEETTAKAWLEASGLPYVYMDSAGKIANSIK